MITQCLSDRDLDSMEFIRIYDSEFQTNANFYPTALL